MKAELGSERIGKGRLNAMASSQIKALWNHPTGPKTIHFWAPAFKWGLSVANIVDLQSPPETVSYPIQAAMFVSGTIWARYSYVVIPKNMPLFSVSVATAATGACQLIRKLKHDAQKPGVAE